MIKKEKSLAQMFDERQAAIRECETCGKIYVRSKLIGIEQFKRSRFCSLSCKYLWMRTQSPPNKGLKGWTNSRSFKIGHTGIRGSMSNKWKGGISKMKWYKHHQYRLYYQLKRNAEGRFTNEEWEGVKDLYFGFCWICGLKKKLTVDHMIPLTRNGRGSIDNIQPLCLACNAKKGNREKFIIPSLRVRDWMEQIRSLNDYEISQYCYGI